jgi:hypothetical protein
MQALLYRNVIDEVIRNVRREFVNMGVDEQVLEMLKRTWEEKLVDSGVLSATGLAPVAAGLVPLAPLATVPGSVPITTQGGIPVMPNSAMAVLQQSHQPPVVTPGIVPGIVTLALTQRAPIPQRGAPIILVLPSSISL